ncbi:MAG: leucine-rich repeat domain-containing protein [Ruminococcus sp.]|nr:leucine-rich repeat domain-containing protein [Ruminococcus sp.]
MNMKKSISLIITLLGLICVLSLSFIASAEEDGIFTYTVTDGKATITKINYTNLDEIRIPETLGGNEVTTIDDDVMHDYTLEFGDDTVNAVYIPKTVTTIETRAFHYADVRYLIVDENNPNYSSDEYGVLFNKDKTELIKAPCCLNTEVYNVPDSVTEIGAYSFCVCLFVKEISLPDTVNTIEIQAFFNAESLEKINIPEGITTIEQMCFAACSSLKEVSLPSTLTTIRNSAFTECYALETIVIPEGVTALETYAFENDTELKQVYLPSTLQSVRSGVFGNCKLLTDICYAGSEDDWGKIAIDTNVYLTGRPVIIDTAVIHYNINPDAYKNIRFEDQNDILTISGSGTMPTSTENTWHYWDRNKADITTLIIDNSISSIGSYSFKDFASLTTVIIDTDSITIDSNSFVNCPNLKNVIIFGNSNLEITPFVSCSENIQLFENTEYTHTTASTNQNVNIIPFQYDGSALTFTKAAKFSSYEFFDSMAAFSLRYENIEKIKFTELAFENMPIYYVPTGGASLKQIEDNTLKNGEVYPSLNGDDPISFNELIIGMSDGSITHFYLITSDENHSNILDTEIKISDTIREVIARAIRWVVTLLNKLFNIVSKIFK